MLLGTIKLTVVYRTQQRLHKESMENFVSEQIVSAVQSD